MCTSWLSWIESRASRSSKGPLCSVTTTTITTLFAFPFLVLVTTLAWLATLLSWQTLGSLVSQPVLTTIYFWSDLFPQLFLIYEATVNTLGGIIYLPSMVLGDKESSRQKYPTRRCPLQNSNALFQCPVANVSPMNLPGWQELKPHLSTHGRPYNNWAYEHLKNSPCSFCSECIVGTEIDTGTRAMKEQIIRCENHWHDSKG